MTTVKDVIRKYQDENLRVIYYSRSAGRNIAEVPGQYLREEVSFHNGNIENFGHGSSRHCILANINTGKNALAITVID